MTGPEYWARPKSADGSTSLLLHLGETRETILELANSGESLSEVASVAAYLHDFAKLTTWFQSYIRKVSANDTSNYVSLTREEERQKQHARLSAYAVEYALHKRDVPSDWRVYAFIAVVKHHQSLPDTDGSISRTINTEREQNGKRFSLIQKQLINIYENANSTADSLLKEATDGAGSLDDFVAYVNNRRTHQTLSEFDASEKTYSDLLHLWGLLITADKLASAALEPTLDSQLSPDAIDDYIEQLPSPSDSLHRQLNERREAARQNALANIPEFQQANTNIGTITLPTGFGKTLTGIQTALSLADATSRVIYALPYTSIIDQVDDVIRTVFGVSPTDTEYTIHHHLAETRTIPPDTQVDTDASELLAQTWQSSLVLTTFVQLFESLAGPTNRQSVKIPALENAVIVLDEPQALPKKWWHFVTWSIDFLVDEFNATVIFMTATQPQLPRQLPYADEPYQLVDNPETQFEFLSDNPRVEYSLDESLLQYIESPRKATPLALNAATSRLAKDEATSVLTVGNTTNNVAEIGNRLLEYLDNAASLNTLLETLYQDEVSAEANTDDLVQQLTAAAQSSSGPIVSTLTSRLRPLDRLILLKTIRRLLESETPLYVASTQLIEAGVDVSFDRLYRDIAPLPSLIQAAGRCNREFGGETAEVTIWRLESSEFEITPSELIYDDRYDLLKPTTETLDNIQSNGLITESVMAQDGATQYFEKVHTETKPGDRTLVRDGQQAKFGSLRRESMIPDNHEQIDIYIAMTENEMQLIEAYQSLLNTGHYDRLRNLRDVLGQRRVSVPDRDEYTGEPNIRQLSEEENIYYLDMTTSKGAYRIQGGGQFRND